MTWFSRSSQSGSPSSSLAFAAAPRIAFSSRAVSPVWLECASSTITAYFRLAIAASHSLRLLLLLFGRLLLALGAGHVEQPAQDERELLQRRDDDLRAVDQRRGQLLRVLVDRLHDALRVLDLVDRVLQLLVEHAADR